MQERLPEMRPGAVDQSDRSPRAPAEAIAKASYQFQARRTATNHDDPVQPLLASAIAYPGMGICALAIPNRLKMHKVSHPLHLQRIESLAWVGSGGAEMPPATLAPDAGREATEPTRAPLLRRP
jgi:hypothetical protein